MNNKEERLFTTGEFAKLFSISKQTLIFYDNIEILKPYYKDSKNFRYYSINQIDTLDALLGMKELGIPLEEIKKYLEERNPVRCIKMLEKEEQELDNKIKRLKKIKKRISQRIDIIKEGNVEKNKDIYIKEMCKEYLILSKDINNDYMIQAIDLVNYINNKGISTGYTMGAILKKERLLQGNYKDQGKFFLKVDKSIKCDRIYEKSSGTFICKRHIGKYEDSYKTYTELIEYINKNNYKIVGDSYEYSIFDYFVVKDPNEYVTEICIQVEKC